MKDEIIINVDENDNEIGFIENLMHILKEFSIEQFQYLYLMITKNYYYKKIQWKVSFTRSLTNTCCTHPNKNEDTKDAANRRLKEEMGIYSNLREIFSFIYYVKFDNNLIEHEFDHVFFGKYNGSIKFNPIEVEDYKWISLDKLKTDLKKT